MKTRNQKIALLLLNTLLAILVSVAFFIQFVHIAEEYIPKEFVLISLLVPFIIGLLVCYKMIKNN